MMKQPQVLLFFFQLTSRALSETKLQELFINVTSWLNIRLTPKGTVGFNIFCDNKVLEHL